MSRKLTSEGSSQEENEKLPFKMLPIKNEEEKYLNFLIQAWNKTVDVQQHFNQLCLTIRTSAITVLGAGFAAIPFLIKEGFTINFYHWPISPSTIIFLLLLLFVWPAFYFFDRWWYHRFLQGAGIEAGHLERKIQTLIPEWQLSGHISKESKIEILGYTVNSTSRLDFFYIFFELILFVILILSLNKNFITVGKPTDQSSLFSKIDSLITKKDSLLIIEIDRRVLKDRTNTIQMLDSVSQLKLPNHLQEIKHN